MRDLPPSLIFNISVTYDRKNYSLKIEITKSGDRLEYISFTSGGKRFVLESNRPIFRAKKLWKRNYDVKLVQGETYNASLLERVVELIKEVIQSYENYDPDYQNPKNKKGPHFDWDHFEKLD